VTGGSSTGRWRFARLRAALQPPNGIALNRWTTEQGRRLSGRIVNIGSGTDDRLFGQSVVRVDAFAPRPTVRADLEHPLPFMDEAFDGAVCTEVLEHVRHAQALLEEVCRVLRPGAPLVITIPFVFRYHPDPGDYRRLTPAGLGAELGRAGFDVQFLGGIGGRCAVAWLMVESLHPLLKATMRVLWLPFRPLFSARKPRHGTWSTWAPHAVAVATKRADRSRASRGRGSAGP
jgi:SAM-dependent methyltransferase